MEIDKLNFSALMDVELETSVVIAQKEMKFGDIIKLTPGSIIYFEKKYFEPVELYINGRNIAVGDVVKLSGKFGFRIKEIKKVF